MALLITVSRMNFAQAICSLLLLLEVSAVKVEFDRAYCTEIKGDNQNSTNSGNVPDFPSAFSAIAEHSESIDSNEELTSLELLTLQYSKPNGEMFIETRDGKSSLFVDSEQNMCLLLSQRNGQCVATKQSCDALTYLPLKNGKTTLKRAREFLGLDTIKLDTVVKLEKSQIRGINSIAYVACKNMQNSTATTISQWHFLDNSKLKSRNEGPVLLMTRYQVIDENSASVQNDQTDFIDFKEIQSDDKQFYIDVEHVDCIFDNTKDVKKTIPKPPTTFSCIKETHVVLAGGNDRDRDVETIHYNYDAAWFHSDAHLIPLDSGNRTEVKIKVTEDFFTGVQYEMSKLGKGCTVSSNLSKAGFKDSDGDFVMKTPTQFWNIDPDTTVYLGEVVIRGIPCDAWRVGFQNDNSNGNTTLTHFLANKKWLKKRRLPEHSFFPVQSIVKRESSVTHHSYFEFKEKFSYFVPDVSSCFNSNQSMSVRLILLTSFYKNIKSSSQKFELKFRKAVLDNSGMESILRVTNIRARPSFFVPFQTRVTFKILSKFKITSNFTIPDVQITHYASEAVTKLKKAIVSGKFQLTQIIKSKNIVIKAEPYSFSLLKYEYLSQDNDEEDTISGFSLGAVVGLCIFALVVGTVVGFGAVYSYKRWSDKKLQEIVESGKPSTSTNNVKVSGFGMLELSTDEVSEP